MKFFLLLSLLALYVGLAAQTNAPIRIEISDEQVDEVYSLTLENKQYYLIEHQRKTTSKGDQWVLEIFDWNLKKVGNKDLFMPADLGLFDHRLMNDTILWLCFAEENGKHASMMIYKINTNTLNIKQVYFQGNRKSQLKAIEVLGSKLLLIGDEMSFVQTEIAEKQLPTDFQISAPTLPNDANVISSISDFKRRNVALLYLLPKGDDKGFYYAEVGFDGQVVKNRLPEAEKVNVLDGSLVLSDEGDLLFMGTYNMDFGKQPDEQQIMAEGTYFGKIRASQFDFFNTIPFAEFSNVFSTLDYKQQMRLKRRIVDGKEVEVGFKLLVHEQSIKQGDTYIMTTERYFPEYHYESNFDSRGYMYQMEVFDGYRTSHCIVTAFNGAGRLLWDNFMIVDDIREYYLRENVLVFDQSDSSIVMAYYADDAVKSQVVKGNKVVFKKTEDVVETVMMENVISESMGRIEKWYDHFFILSGYQVIIGKNSKKRKVFFFNLITFE